MFSKNMLALEWHSFFEKIWYIGIHKKPKKDPLIQIIAANPNDIEILHKIAINLLEQ